MTRYVGAIDQGTTSTRFMVFDRAGTVVAMARREHRQIFPEPGWVEHDPMEILANTRATIDQALRGASLTARDLAAVGIANQRETTVLWDRATGEPVHNALVWQDTRVAPMAVEMARDGGPDRFRDRTGLPLASYFSALKLRWLLEHAGRHENLAFGTIDAWLMWHLTGRHVVDVTNASRTQLMNLDTLDWDDTLLTAFGIPRSVLPRIVPSSGDLGTGIGVLDGVRISGILGDQQAALMGQACLAPGEAKNTYGTGCFLLMHTGTAPVRSRHGLLTTVAAKLGSDPATYALEGSVAIAGALVQWLRDNLGLIRTSDEIETLADSVGDNGGVYFVPAFSGLYAPHWDDTARGIVAGLTRFANKGHIARAALEASAFQTLEVVRAMEQDSGIAARALRVDGGMTVNRGLMQFQADILGHPVVRPTVLETTALGAAYAAGLAVGYWAGLDDLRANWAVAETWTPAMAPDRRAASIRDWSKAVERSKGWV